MNREIKFRAWNKKEKYMEIVDDLQMFSNDLSIGIPSKDYFLRKDDVELMQYTGLHDKNEKEIYEGDIVLLDCYNYEEPAFDGEFKVIYDDINGMWLLIDLENKDRDFTFGEIRSYYKAEIEVIGNIYDNPELLGGE